MNDIADIKRLQELIAMYEDRKAYQDLYHLFFAKLRRFSFLIVRSSEVSEEIVSDVFIKVWQIRERLMEIQHLKVYLYTITKNFSLNYIARQSGKGTINIDLLDVDISMTLPGPAELCISSDTISQIRLVIDQLPPRCKMIFQLVKEDGMKYKEVAEILHISVPTVRNQVALAVKKMSERLPAHLYSGIHHHEIFSRS